MDVPPSVRDTPEYQAAWDLEVWKAEEKKKFQTLIEKERLDLCKRFEEDMARRERERVEAFEKQKSQVQGLSQRVTKTLEALQEREDMVSQREVELNRKKSALVLDYEKKVREAEDKTRHLNEVQYFNLEALKTQSNELQMENQTLRSQLDTVKEEFASVCTDFSEYKKKVLLPAAPNEQHLQLLEETQRLSKEKILLEEQLQKANATSARHKNQIKKIASDYNDLLKITHKAQMETLENERNTLRRAQALQEAAAVRHLTQRERVQEETVIAHEQPVVRPTGKTMEGMSGVEELRALLVEAELAEKLAIQAEVKQKKPKKKKKPKQPSQQPVPVSPSASVPTDPSQPPSPGVSLSSCGASSPHPTTFNLPPDALTSLKKEVANRDRLLLTGVMEPTDDYIVQLTASIEQRCAEYGITPQDLQ